MDGGLGLRVQGPASFEGPQPAKFGDAIYATRGGTATGSAVHARREGSGGGPALLVDSVTTASAVGAEINRGTSASGSALSVTRNAPGDGAGILVFREDPGTGDGVRAVRSGTGIGAGIQGFGGVGATDSPSGGVGVRGVGSSIGVRAESTNVALHVQGKAKFTTATAKTAPSGTNDIFISDPSVTAVSLINITITSDPGGRDIRWVERAAASGYTLHMNPVPPAQRTSFQFTAFIVEPA